MREHVHGRRVFPLRYERRCSTYTDTDHSSSPVVHKTPGRRGLNTLNSELRCGYDDTCSSRDQDGSSLENLVKALIYHEELMKRVADYSRSFSVDIIMSTVASIFREKGTGALVSKGISIVFIEICLCGSSKNS